MRMLVCLLALSAMIGCGPSELEEAQLRSLEYAERKNNNLYERYKKNSLAWEREAEKWQKASKESIDWGDNDGVTMNMGWPAYDEDWSSVGKDPQFLRGRLQFYEAHTRFLDEIMKFHNAHTRFLKTR